MDDLKPQNVSAASHLAKMQEIVARQQKVASGLRDIGHPSAISAERTLNLLTAALRATERHLCALHDGNLIE